MQRNMAHLVYGTLLRHIESENVKLHYSECFTILFTGISLIAEEMSAFWNHENVFFF